MYVSLKVRVLIALASFFVSSSAFCCSDGPDWDDFSKISFATAHAGNITLARFTNGTHAVIQDEKSKKEMYQFNTGLNLYKGLTDAEQAGATPFFMLDMGVGVVLSFLAQHFKRPCLITLSEKSFSYVAKMAGAEIDVTGTTRRDAASAIFFSYSAVERKEGGKTIGASGRIEFADLAPVPSDTDIAGWTVARGIGVKDIVKPTRPISTIQDLVVP